MSTEEYAVLFQKFEDLKMVCDEMAQEKELCRYNLADLKALSDEHQALVQKYDNLESKFNQLIEENQALQEDVDEMKNDEMMDQLLNNDALKQLLQERRERETWTMQYDKLLADKDEEYKLLTDDFKSLFEEHEKLQTDLVVSAIKHDKATKMISAKANEIKKLKKSTWRADVCTAVLVSLGFYSVLAVAATTIVSHVGQ